MLLLFEWRLTIMFSVKATSFNILFSLASIIVYLGLLANTPWGHFSPLFLLTVILLSTIYLSSSSSSSCSLFILLLFLLLPPTWVWHLPALLPLQGTTKVQGLHQGPEQTQRQEGGEWGGRDNKRKERGRRGERWGFDRDCCVKYWTKLRYLFVLNQQKCVI